MTLKTNQNKAVFLDRDGVINRELGRYIFDPSDFELNDDVSEALKLLCNSGFLLIVITNQGGIGRGLYTNRHVEIIHDKLKKRLAESDILLNEIYYCPHHPSTGRCLCRKPGSLMIEKAIGRFGIDAARSFMIGDRERDIEAAENAGVKGILIRSNESLMPFAAVIAGKK
jgi:D-glycero-D-manno-heptose 1,7-bisphosphate phosphatase